MTHPKTLDPILDEIRRLILILQNDDGSWGFQDNPLDRAFVTSWAIKSMTIYNEEECVRNGILFFKKYLDDASYDLVANFRFFARESFLKGFFNCTPILAKSHLISRSRLMSCLLNLLDELERRDWLSSISLAAYAAYGIKDLNLEKYRDMLVPYEKLTNCLFDYNVFSDQEIRLYEFKAMYPKSLARHQKDCVELIRNSGMNVRITVLSTNVRTEKDYDVLDYTIL